MRALILTIVFWGIGSAAAGTPSWQAELVDETTWSRLTYAGTLIAATEKSLTHYNAEDGSVMWQRDDLNRLAQFNVNDVPGTPFLVISERVGNVPPKSHLQVLNLSTGETLWDAGEVAGAGLAAYPVPDKDLLIYVADLHGKKPGNYVTAYSLSTGEQQWQTKLGSVGTMPQHPSDISGFIPTMDLNGHPQPVVDGDMMYIAAGNIFAVSLADGSHKWTAKIKASIANLKNTYAQPIISDGVIYAASKNSIHAINPETGKDVWKVKVGNAAMPELHLLDDKLVGRLGGSFSNGKNLTGAKPFGAFAVSTAGKLLWKWTKAKDSITNMQILDEQGLVVLADKKKLYGLDLNASKKGKLVFDHKLEFKRKMGSAEVAAKGLGVASGLLSGGIAGGLKGLGGGDRGDPPLDVSVIDNRAIVRAQYHVLAYSLESNSTDWSIQFAPPGMSPFALIAMGAVTATVAANSASASRASSGYYMSRSYADSAINVTNAFQDAAARRYAATEKSQSLAFFLTREEEGMVLLGIDLTSGEEVGRIAMAEKEPQFMVDAPGNRVYYFRDKRELLAYDF